MGLCQKFTLVLIALRPWSRIARGKKSRNLDLGAQLGHHEAPLAFHECSQAFHTDPHLCVFLVSINREEGFVGRSQGVPLGEH